MKIGIVTTWFERGAAYVSRQFRDALSKEHEVVIYARGGERYAETDPRWDDPQVTWAKRSYNPKVTTFPLSDFRHWLDTQRPDIVFFNEQHWWKPVLLCARLGITTGSYVDYYTERTLPLFGLYDFLICCTRRHASAFDWHPQAHYLPWGTDIELFRPNQSELVSPGEVTFFHSCGWDPVRKGTEAVLNAFSQLQGPCRLLLHTQVPLGRTVEMERVEVIEETVPAPGLFHRGDVYVYPSKIEGIGLTLAEAMASGLALITTDHGPMNEFLDPACGSGVNITRLYSRHDGYYWPLCKVDEDHLREVMQQYVDQRDQLPARKVAAREFAERQLDWHSNAAQLPALFREAQKRQDTLKESAMACAQTEDSLWATPVGEIISQIPPLMKFLQGVVRLRERLRQGNLLDRL